VIRPAILLCVMLATPAFAQEPVPAEAVVQRQVEAYNSFDIDAFLATYAEDAEIRFDAPGQALRGREALRAFYAPGFSRRDTTVRIGHRSVLGDTIVDEEHVTIRGRETCCAVIVYKVANGRIASALLFASPQLLQAFRD
jgi:hypothetical protein